MKGISTHAKIIMAPAKITKIWNNIPKIIRIILIRAPIILEKIFEIKVLKNSPTSNPLG